MLVDITSCDTMNFFDWIHVGSLPNLIALKKSEASETLTQGADANELAGTMRNTDDKNTEVPEQDDQNINIKNSIESETQSFLHHFFNNTNRPNNQTNQKTKLT
ncbi:hypothetical protein C5167_005092 [Papaver somniferum]|uniref:Uncharacterized protein n=1 Tax=Papaver somniferum TaxID=3469 RepID=A0A4Y7JCR2_PAPSO|nr:hypothetical protein C5167_005092 [Papaver somniferum]